MKISVLYDLDTENNLLFPLWMMINHFSFDWSKTIYIDLETPFERFTFEEIESEVLALTVPDNVYVRHPDKKNQFGIYLPSLEKYITKTMKGSSHHLELCNIQRLMLSISDIETTLETEIHLFWSFIYGTNHHDAHSEFLGLSSPTKRQTGWLRPFKISQFSL
ncbi:hypothetical protein [Paenibacillus sp. YAF4_2]|uniref:hypothetical protein n=1 Tax=Paenibacillus sp. YAF4_2 TaxID=3233085 RepID=UPI003F96A87A